MLHISGNLAVLNKTSVLFLWPTVLSDPHPLPNSGIQGECLCPAWRASEGVNLPQIDQKFKLTHPAAQSADKLNLNEAKNPIEGTGLHHDYFMFCRWLISKLQYVLLFATVWCNIAWSISRCLFCVKDIDERASHDRQRILSANIVLRENIALGLGRKDYWTITFGLHAGAPVCHCCAIRSWTWTFNSILSWKDRATSAGNLFGYLVWIIAMNVINIVLEVSEKIEETTTFEIEMTSAKQNRNSTIACHFKKNDRN